MTAYVLLRLDRIAISRPWRLGYLELSASDPASLRDAAMAALNDRLSEARGAADERP